MSWPSLGPYVGGAASAVVDNASKGVAAAAVKPSAIADLRLISAIASSQSKRARKSTHDGDGALGRLNCQTNWRLARSRQSIGEANHWPLLPKRGTNPVRVAEARR